MSKSGRLLDESVVFSRNIDWNLFKVFREIARHGGVGAAARALNRQQPSVSAALKRLEEHVGVPLCVRSSRGIALTAFGRELLATCEGMYASVQHIPRAADMEKRDVRGQVTLRVISNLHLVTELNEVFADFHQRHPHIEIKLDVAPCDSAASSPFLARLMTLDQRLFAFEAAGIHAALVLRFDRDLAQMSPGDFARQYLLETMRAKAVLVGENFRFGHRQAGRLL